MASSKGCPCALGRSSLTLSHWKAQKGVDLPCLERRHRSSSKCLPGSPREPHRSRCARAAAATSGPPAASSHSKWRSGSHHPGSDCCTTSSSTNCPGGGPEQTRPASGLSLVRPPPNPSAWHLPSFPGLQLASSLYFWTCTADLQNLTKIHFKILHFEVQLPSWLKR